MLIYNLNNVEILDLKVYNKVKDIYLEDTFPNLIKLKLRNDEYYNTLIKIPLNLLKRIKVLSLKECKIEIFELNDNFIELSSLESLEIKDNNYLNEEEITCIRCPKLKYFFCAKRLITYTDNFSQIFKNEIFLKGINSLKINYSNQIFIKYPNLTYIDFRFQFIQSGIKYYNKNNRILIIKKYENNLIHSEIKNINRNYFSVKSYYKESYYNNLNIERGVLGNYEEIIYRGGMNLKNNIFSKIKSHNFSLQYISIEIGNENNFAKYKIKNLIENINYFLLLRSFKLIIDKDKIFGKKELFDLINNLSKLYLIENIFIQSFIKDLTNQDKINILQLIKDCQIDYNRNSTLLNVGLNDSVFDKFILEKY